MEDQLAASVAEAAGQPCTVRVGTVLSAPPLGELVIDLEGTALNPAAVGVLGSYHPVVGDTVILMGQSVTGADSQGSTWLVAGKAQKSGNPADFIPWTPTWTTSGLPASYGNGVLLCGWQPIAWRLIKLHFYFQFGSTTNPGTGRYFFGTPFTANINSLGATGACYIFDAGTANRAAICNLTSALNSVFLTLTPSGDVGQGTPQSFVTNDEIRWSLDMRI